MRGWAPLIHPPACITRWFPEATWNLRNGENKVYLTFDDGPVPDITPQVLEILNKESAGATFFCVGENVSRYPEIFDMVLQQNHSVGNHTYNHLQGLKTSPHEYFQNIAKAGSIINSNLFRPPHGLLKYSQYKVLSKQYKIIMWDVLSMDHHPRTTSARLIRDVTRFARDGSIITFHDSVKSIAKLKAALPLVIKMLKDKGYSLQPIPYLKH
jgi:peptidoglycan-N-acetylglucosamine deacetylase